MVGREKCSGSVLQRSEASRVKRSLTSIGGVDKENLRKITDNQEEEENEKEIGKT
jgi:hypothetical protein